ncbi:hypothetical protein [Roseovarius sp. MMSF_3281]|uniref:hypothetical protein n=1 Tax=Roseovarius sp. MMSF_3281 TaxID=3046694 RepID=UPI00273F9596|nr:hypothetical protein [Roseovarius sp. MMSF_3281]
MQRLNTADQLLFGLAYASLLFTLLYYVTGFVQQFHDGFAQEDGPIEWSTAIFLFISSLVLARRSLEQARNGAWVATLLVALYALLFFFASGEEISWGQRVFGWETTEFFAENNYQNETNLHNLVIGEQQLAKTLFGSVLTTVLLLYLVALPLMYTRFNWVKTFADALAIPVPGLRHAALAFGASLFIAVVDLPRKWEVYEFIFSVVALSIFIAPTNSDRFDPMA